MQHLTFHPRLILRTPRETFTAEIDEAAIRSYVQNGVAFREALYLASPRLLGAIEAAPDLPGKLLFPLVRYLVRSRYRATPFGLFAGVGTVRWDTHTRLALKAEYRRQTRLDMDYLCTLAAELERDPLLQEHLVYYPNSSLYFLGDHIRYIERNGAPVLSSVKRDPYVTAVLKKAGAGADFSALVTVLEEQGVPREEAGTFLRDMADNQLIVSELEPTVTGTDFLDRLLCVLNRAGHPAAGSLGEIQKKLRQLDEQTANDPALYSAITDRVRQLGIMPDESKLFHTVRVNVARESAGTLSCEYQEEILRVIQKMGAFPADGTSPAMYDFISRFQERYEDEEVPLLTALDTESGIGYRGHMSEDFTPLTEGITLPAREKYPSDLKWKQLQQALFRSLQKAQQDGAYEIPLPDLEPPPEMPDLAPTFAVMFRLVDQQRLFIESIGGSSATHLAGRFGHASEEIGEILHDMNAAENEHNPGVIFAEVVHLPESRTGNILARPAFRSYEIPYLAQSGLPPENRIGLRDLYVSVRNGRVVLRYGNRRVIPRLGCAHNFRNHSLPAYQFLCDLQTQGLHSCLEFSWGDIAREFIFLPRVADGRVIISPAMWQLSAPHLEAVQQPGLSQEDFECWRNRHALPRCFVLAEGDNELFVDTSHPLLLRVFLDSLQGKSRVLLKEFLGADTIPVRNAAGQPLVNQLIAFLVRNETVYDPGIKNHPESTVQRTFSLGSEWVYLKLYCGAKSADLVLENGIAPVVHVAEMNGWTNQWFFVRYHDPDNHLRVRFHLTDTGFLPDLLRLMEYHIQPFQRSGVVWKVQADTYRRELERYGYETIQAVECVFYKDSRMYLDFLRQTEGDEREELKWLWGLRNIDGLLQAAGLDFPGKKALIEDIRNRFAEEFKMDRSLKSQIDRRYRAHRSRMEEFLSEGGVLQDISLAYEPEIRNLWQGIRDTVPEKAAFEQILTSCIHMTINRLISSGQRLHELLMYDFLGRHYTTLVARANT